jgi:hypothetical protein
MAQTHFVFFFFFLGGFRGGRTTPKGLGVASATPYRSYGVAEPTLWPKRGWSKKPPHFLGKGVAPATPRFSFFFFLFFSFLKNQKIRNWSKLRRFGQNSIVLGEPKTA